MPRRNIEEEHQIALIKWARYSVEQYPQLALLHSSLNGVKLSQGLAVKAKRGGMLAGVWDLFLPVPKPDKIMYVEGHPCICTHNANGLYIEMKTKTGRLTESQKWFRNQLQEYYRFEVVRDWRDGRDFLVEYLENV